MSHTQQYDMRWNAFSPTIKWQQVYSKIYKFTGYYKIYSFNLEIYSKIVQITVKMYK